MAMRVIRPLTPRQEDRRQRILSAARAMVADHGYDDMVMSQVAEKAGVSPTTLYNLYNTKDQLIMESLRDLISGNQQRVLASSELPLGWQLVIVFVRQGAWLANAEPAYAEAITYALLRATPGDALVATLLEETRDNFALSVDAMASRDELLAGTDIARLATSLTGVYWSTFILWNKGLVALKEMELTLQLNCLSMLMAAGQGEAVEQMHAEYRRLLAAEKAKEE